MDGRDVQIPPVFYRTLSPSGFFIFFSKASKRSKEDGSKIALVNPKPIPTLVLPWEPLKDSTTHNSILNVLSGPSELVQMKLLYSTCVPILTYASDVVCFPGKEMQLLHVAVNDAIRRIFSYHTACFSSTETKGDNVSQLFQ